MRPAEPPVRPFPPVASWTLHIGNRAGYARAVNVLVALGTAVATSVLLGWLLHIEVLKRIAPGLTSMNPVTALCFEAAAGALWIIRKGPAPAALRTVSVALSLAVALVGLAKMTDLYAGTHLCPDALLFPSQLNSGQPFPSRIAPNAAFCFVLLGLALLAVDRPWWPRVVHPHWLVTPIFCVALAAIIGYAYDTSGFYKYKQFIPMALHTATCFLLLAAALILSRPGQGYLRRIPVGSPGARSFARLLPACVLLPTVFGGLALWGNEHGWFAGRGTGSAVATVLTILGLAALAYGNAVALNRTEAIRRSAEAKLEKTAKELDLRNQELQHEVAERTRMEALAAHRAAHDPLTGLPNRLLFVERLERAIAQAVRHGTTGAVFYIDVDHFKPVNDRYGHAAGDELLKELARRIQSTLRAVDTAARLGGDEFAAIIDAPVRSQDALELARRLSAAVCLPFAILLPGQPGPVEVTVGISIGIALFSTPAVDLDTLVKSADSAMYRAKSDGRTRGLSQNIAMAAA